MRFPDIYDWHGCAAVQFDPEKLCGRAIVGQPVCSLTGFLENYLDGLTIEEIVESYGVDRIAVEQILAFAAAKGLQATA